MQLPMSSKRGPEGQSDYLDGEGAANASLTRRDFFKGAGLTSLTAAVSPSTLFADEKAMPADGTPEQIHLPFGDDLSGTVFVSWASAAQAINPRVLMHAASGGKTVIHAVQRTYTDGLNGQTVFTYHAK